MALVLRPNERLERLLDRLGVVYAVDPTALEAATLDGAPLAVTSASPLHQVRQLLVAARLPLDRLDPTDDEGRAWRRILLDLAEDPIPDDEGGFDPSRRPLRGLESALDVHQALQTLLLRHRIAVMQADLLRARATWDEFRAHIRHHLAVEDELVAPAYRRHVPVNGWPRGGNPEILDGEHDKIRDKLDALTASLERLAAARFAPRQREAACLGLLDRQKTLDHILEHHDLRERRLVYPHLETVLATEAKARIVRALLAPPAREA